VRHSFVIKFAKRISVKLMQINSTMLCKNHSHGNSHYKAMLRRYVQVSARLTVYYASVTRHNIL